MFLFLLGHKLIGTHKLHTRSYKKQITVTTNGNLHKRYSTMAKYNMPNGYCIIMHLLLWYTNLIYSPPMSGIGPVVKVVDSYLCEWG